MIIIFLLFYLPKKHVLLIPSYILTIQNPLYHKELLGVRFQGYNASTKIYFEAYYIGNNNYDIFFNENDNYPNFYIRNIIAARHFSVQILRL